MTEYPRELYLKDNTMVIARPLNTDDIEALCNFFTKIPKHDLLIYKDDMTNMESVETWFAHTNYKETFQLVGLIKDRIVAKGTLGYQGLFWSHAAELKLIVDPQYRGKGLGSQFFNILLYEGLRNHFQKIIVKYISDNSSFMKILDHYGFNAESVLSYYVKDESSDTQKDLVIASFSLEHWDRRFEFYSSLYG